MSSKIHPNLVPSAVRRSSRQASRLASERISRIIADQVSEDEASPQPKADVWTEAPKTICVHPSATILKYYLELADKAPTSEERTEIATKIYEHLLSEHTLLIQYPKFRAIVVQKGKNFLEEIKECSDEVENCGFATQQNVLRSIIHKSVRNGPSRKNMLKLLNELSDSFSEYTVWSKRDRLKQAIQIVLDLADSLKTHPNYVS